MTDLQKVFTYNGNEIEFKVENETTYMNATKMARIYGRL